MILKTLISILISSGIGILIIDYINKPVINSIESQYQRIITLWQFKPINLIKLKENELYNRDIWYWRKLLLAGVMIASSISSILIKRSSIKVIISVFVLIVIIWLLFLLIFWYNIIINKYNKSIPINDTTTNTTIKPNSNIKSDNTWLQRNRNIDSKVDTRLPLTIITGFLGSGKTTLIKHILTNTIGLRILVIENEIGKEGIDHDLLLQQIKTIDEENKDIILLNNGCICCSVRKDLLNTLNNIISNDSYSYLDWIVIETSGLSDPAPFIQSIYMDKRCNDKIRLDSVITIVDAKHISNHLSNNNLSNEAIRQIMYADRILLNKIDLLNNEIEINELKSMIASINTYANILTSQYSQIDLELILNIKAFDPLTNQSLTNQSFNILDKSKQQINKHIDTQIITLTSTNPLDINKFNIFLCNLLQLQGVNIYRLKGILYMYGYEEMFVCHGIHMIFDGFKGIQWNDTNKYNKLIIIGRLLDEESIRLQFNNCLVT